MAAIWMSVSLGFLPALAFGTLRRVRGKVWWAKRRRKIVRRDKGKVVEFEEVRYGMLMLVLCDREGSVYDVWITFGCGHEVGAFRERKKRSLWFRGQKT